jgi:hypothetical protein
MSEICAIYLVEETLDIYLAIRFAHVGLLGAWLMYIKLDAFAPPKADRLLYLDAQALTL